MMFRTRLSAVSTFFASRTVVDISPSPPESFGPFGRKGRRLGFEQRPVASMNATKSAVPRVLAAKLACVRVLHRAGTEQYRSGSRPAAAPRCIAQPRGTFSMRNRLTSSWVENV
jgi:hypothetical protein